MKARRIRSMLFLSSARITRIEKVGEDNEDAISCAPSALPEGGLSERTDLLVMGPRVCESV